LLVCSRFVKPTPIKARQQHWASKLSFRPLDRPDGLRRLIVETSSRAAINANACECHSARNVMRGGSNASTVRHKSREGLSNERGEPSALVNTSSLAPGESN